VTAKEHARLARLEAENARLRLRPACPWA